MVNCPLANTSLSNSLLATCFLWKISLEHGSRNFYWRKHKFEKEECNSGLPKLDQAYALLFTRKTRTYKIRNCSIQRI